MSLLRTAVVIDYQNIHLTGHDEFADRTTAKHTTLVHPLHFANQLILARSNAMTARGGDPGNISLELVDTYRGLPTNAENPRQYRRSQLQMSEWTRDRRVSVTYRPLQYFGPIGQRISREKGVDVLVALAVVRLVQSGDYDLVILAAHDSDLEPALEQSVTTEAVKDGHVRIETAGWKGRKRLRAGRSTLWHTFMLDEHFSNSRDTRVY